MRKDNEPRTIEEQVAYELHNEIVQKGLFFKIKAPKEYACGQFVVTVFNFNFYKILSIKGDNVLLGYKDKVNLHIKRTTIENIRPVEGFIEAISELGKLEAIKEAMETLKTSLNNIHFSPGSSN